MLFYRLNQDGTYTAVNKVNLIEGMTTSILRTELIDKDDNIVLVSTMFTSIDTDIIGQSKRLFETMIFDGPLSDQQWRYDNIYEAREHHIRLCQKISRQYGYKVSERIDNYEHLTLPDITPTQIPIGIRLRR